ncbi:hypothetical protein ELE36_00455 [Pseudolysobacter antarcticus]|uniref:Uncharacterized protein n=1 Tax=Pseudolysobacter antarcticus TaxID=2511995 RepID=A0A411HER0_9GAMM|nr:hypothetical protein [Pseudolysobacter antarcticus]QBB68968.1 hypothetical protein ELE36_00455 [Pseudolysobacter antarcticus]
MRNIRRSMLALLALLISSVALVNVASAQANACVSLLVGAGYAAEMRVVSGSFHTDWSSSFPIGKTVCQSLSGVGDGNKFSVEVHALAGKTKTCTPDNVTRVAASTSNVTYQAWGSTLSVKCEEATVAANAERDAATMTVSPDGQKAAATAGTEKH